MLFSILVIVSVFVFWTPVRVLAHFSLWEDNPYDKYSYIMAIPFISGALVLFARREIFASVRYGFRTGIILLLAGLILNWSAGSALKQLGKDASLSINMLSLVVLLLAAFILCYGTRAFRAGAFPLLFLLLTVPIPDRLLDKPVTAVQYGSTGVCSLIFSLAGVPHVRNGLEFSLSDVTIKVAKECSGIHSTLAILIISLIAGHLFLPSLWKKVMLVLLALPIVCITNGLRIAGLTLLAEYFNPSFLHGNLHHRGGSAFFSLALLLLFGVLHVLRKGQSSAPSTPAKV
jgi:exosortase